MSRRKKRSGSRQGKSAEPAGNDACIRTPPPPRPRKWLLATAIVLQAAWIAVLAVLALTG